MTDDNLLPCYDRNHVGNSEKYLTGKKCIEPGCDKPAGTRWSHLWCVDCNMARMRRIDAFFESELKRMKGETDD